MKQITSLFLALCMLAQASVPAFWVLDYQLRRAVYLKQCKNKNNPELHCDGKCYLKKRMMASPVQDAKAPRLPENFYSIKDLNLYCEQLQTIMFGTMHTPGLLQTLPPYLRYCPDAPAVRFFKPPTV